MSIRKFSNSIRPMSLIEETDQRRHSCGIGTPAPDLQAITSSSADDQGLKIIVTTEGGPLS